MLNQKESDRLYYEKLQGKFDCRHYFGVCKKCDLPPMHGKGCTCVLDFSMTCTCKEEKNLPKDDKYKTIVLSKQLDMLNTEILSTLNSLDVEEDRLYFNALFESMVELRKEYKSDDFDGFGRFYKDLDIRMRAYKLFYDKTIMPDDISWSNIPILKIPLRSTN